jgi:hypothetical protein
MENPTTITTITVTLKDVKVLFLFLNNFVVVSYLAEIIMMRKTSKKSTGHFSFYSEEKLINFG